MRLESVPVIVLLATSAAAQISQPAPKPMGKIELVALLSYGSATDRLPKQVEQRGINFEVDQNYLQVLADAGAGDDLVSALKAAKPVTAAVLSTDDSAEKAAKESSVLQHLVRTIQLNPNGIHLREAEPEYRAAVQADPGNPITHLTLGSVLSRLGRHDDAAAEFRETLRLQPNSADAHLGLAGVFLSDKMLNEAMVEIKEAIRLEPDKAEPHLIFANALDMRGDKEQAVEQRRIAKELWPPSQRYGFPSRIRLGGQIEAAKLVYHPKITYPGEAKKSHVEGTVRLTIIVGKDGAVKDWEVESGDPLLVPTALESVRQWRYQPTLLNKVPVEVLTEIDVNFTLSR